MGCLEGFLEGKGSWKALSRCLEGEKHALSQSTTPSARTPMGGFQVEIARNADRKWARFGRHVHERTFSSRRDFAAIAIAIL